MQVADQIRMQTGGEHELLLQVPGERAQGRTDGEDGETGQKADRYAAGSDRKGETAAEKAVRRLQREKAAREQEIEDKLLQMIEEGEVSCRAKSDTLELSPVSPGIGALFFFSRMDISADRGARAPLLDACLKKQNLKVEEFFGCFLASPDLRRQIFACMERILEDKNRAINIILTGEERSGKTTLAKSIAKCTQMLGGISSPRVAVIRGDKLNHIDLEVKKQQLRGTTMIVEHAAGMTGEKAAQLLSLNTDFAGETAVILEEERRRMNQFLRGNEELDRVYTNRVHLPEWSVEDCFMQALWMLYSNEYFMTESVAEGFHV